jgi:hypothetical protein
VRRSFLVPGKTCEVEAKIVSFTCFALEKKKQKSEEKQTGNEASESK